MIDPGCRRITLGIETDREPVAKRIEDRLAEVQGHAAEGRSPSRPRLKDDRPSQA